MNKISEPQCKIRNVKQSRERILIVDPIHEYAIKELRKTYDVHYQHQPPTNELYDLIKDASVVVLRSGIQLPAQLIQAGQRLKIIARAGNGVDNIDLDVAAEKRIMVFNVPDTSVISVAEHTMGLILSLARHIPLADRQLRNNQWMKEDLVGTELHQKTLGIVGLGKIGKQVAIRARAFDMRVLANVAHYSEERCRDEEKEGVTLTGFNNLLEQSDYISLHCPLAKATSNLFEKEQFRRMKSSAYLINMARGGVVNELDLLQAIKSSEIKGAASDVFSKEGEYSRLLDLDNMIGTPHIGAMTAEAQFTI
ncbi:MAG: hydroxyacid dehydrogenase, partial [Sedimenticola sp.]